VTRKFQVGDRVRVVAPSRPQFRGAVGTIVSGPFEWDGQPDAYELAMDDFSPSSGAVGFVGWAHFLAPIHDGDEKLSWSDERVVWKPRAIA